MGDENYWKSGGGYEETWAKSSRREEKIRDLLIKETGAHIQLVGFGAGSTELFSGSAKSHGYTKGDADLEVLKTNIRIEVTGPLEEFVKPHMDLWIRPDKIQNAKAISEKYDSWVIHCIGNTDTIRTIHLNSAFFKQVDIGKLKIEDRFIKGKKETYCIIPARDGCVQSLDVIIAHIKSTIGK
jgi:hypothetical protein